MAFVAIDIYILLIAFVKAAILMEWILIMDCDIVTIFELDQGMGSINIKDKDTLGILNLRFCNII